MLSNAFQKIKSRGGFDSGLGRIILEALVLGAFLVAAFMLGRASLVGGSSGQPIVVLEPKNAQYESYYKEYGLAAVMPAKTASGSSKATEAATGSFGASVNGTKYYPKGCSGLNRIKAENLIWFTSEEEAKAAGYSMAANC